MTGRPLRIALVAPSRHPVREPYPGGLEAVVATLATGLRAAGHEVELFAVRGSEGGSERFAFPGITWDDATEATDIGYPPGAAEAEDRAFDELADLLAASARDPRTRVDVVHNHSLHPGLLRRAPDLRAPLLTTLHTPAFWEMQDPITEARAAGRYVGEFAAVSSVVARSWNLGSPCVHLYTRERVQVHTGAASVVFNGVDLDLWRPRTTQQAAPSEAEPSGAEPGETEPGGGGLVWTGRFVPEKAPHLAILAARAAGLPIRLAGRIGDERYVRAEVAPLLGPDAEYVGELDHSGVARLVRGADCALVTPVWDEPFGLVVAEALACGTPVAAFARGGVTEVLGPWADELSTPGDDPADLARVVHRALRVPRSALRARAEDLGTAAMVCGYERLYRSITERGALS